MKKDAYCMFDLGDYSEKQLKVILDLTDRYPMLKWMQLLSPFHCDLIYDELTIEERDIDIAQLYNHLIDKFGKITVQLDYALRMYVQRFRGSKTYEDSYFKVRKEVGKDGDDLGVAIMRELELSTLPMREYVRHNKEIDVEQFILRTPIDEEGLSWCLDFTGFNENNCNIVNMWNTHSANYERYLQESFEENI